MKQAGKANLESSKREYRKRYVGGGGVDFRHFLPDGPGCRAFFGQNLPDRLPSVHARLPGERFRVNDALAQKFPDFVFGVGPRL